MLWLNLARSLEVGKILTLKLASNRAVHTTVHHLMWPAAVLGLQTIWADVFHCKLGCWAQKTPLGLCIRLSSCSSCFMPLPCSVAALLLLWSLLHFYEPPCLLSLAVVLFISLQPNWILGRLVIQFFISDLEPGSLQLLSSRCSPSLWLPHLDLG